MQPTRCRGEWWSSIFKLITTGLSVRGRHSSSIITNESHPNMGIGNQYFDVAATYLKKSKLFDSPQSLAVRPGIQSCPTYIATTQERGPFLLQFRPRDRPLLDEAAQKVVNGVLGNLAPTIKPLGECIMDGKPYLIYEQSIIPGEAFSRIWREVELLPKAAEGIARLLAKCLIPGSGAGTDRRRYAQTMKALEQACHTTDPLLTPYINDFTEIRDAVSAGGLDELPLAVSNGDFSALNILTTKDGDVCGLVDWESKFFGERLLGTDLSAIHWIMRRDRGDRFEDFENTSVIEKHFWAAFFSSIPAEVAAKREALQLAMKMGVVLEGVHEGASNFPMGAPRLRLLLDYVIPSLRLNDSEQ